MKDMLFHLVPFFNQMRGTLGGPFWISEVTYSSSECVPPAHLPSDLNSSFEPEQENALQVAVQAALLLGPADPAIQ